MNLLRRLVQEEDGQGLVEYTLVVVLVALVFWVGAKGSNLGSALSNIWLKVVSAISSAAN